MSDEAQFELALGRVLAFAERMGYAGYSKFDALNSRWLARLALDRPLLRFAYTQVVMRAPWNVRPLLGVASSINPKGMGLFAMAHLADWRRTGADHARAQAVFVLDWLARHGTPGRHGTGWGYNFDWQSTLFFAPRGTSNAIVTTVCGEAFIKAFEALGDPGYLDQARAAANYLRHDLPCLHDSVDELCIAYVPYPVKSVVLNINASAGSLLAKVAKHADDGRLMDDARRMIRFVVDRRTPYDAWYYTHPARNSYILHDNYHTGGIVDALFDYERYSGDRSFHEVYRRALDYYARELFLPDGAPKYMNNRVYPFDIHGSAQGVISFSKAAAVELQYLDLARRVAHWAIENMQDRRRGCFYYQRNRCFTKRFTLQRWCNAWMAKALADLLLAMDVHGRPAGPHFATAARLGGGALSKLNHDEFSDQPR